VASIRKSNRYLEVSEISAVELAHSSTFGGKIAAIVDQAPEPKVCET
jgi:hypothetical protein